jgi:hypothetical protein
MVVGSARSERRCAVCERGTSIDHLISRNAERPTRTTITVRKGAGKQAEPGGRAGPIGGRCPSV